MPTKSLPSYPSLTHFKHQAKDLLKAQKNADPEGLALIAEFHPKYGVANPPEKKFGLTDAQLVIARSYGFASWKRLRDCVLTLDSFACSPHKEPAAGSDLPDEFLRHACLTYGVDHPSRREKARKLLKDHPEIKGSNIYVASALGDVRSVLQFLTQDPKLSRQRGGPHNWEPLLYLTYSRCQESASVLKCGEALLKAGADPNAAYLWDGSPYLFTALTGLFGEGEAGPTNQPRHPECESLATLLLESGANPNDGQVLYNRQFTRGADHLALLLKFGLGKPFKDRWKERLGGKLQTPKEMVAGQLFWAASNGHEDRVKLLLDNGADPNQIGFKGKTPYELALLGGYPKIAELLLERGAIKLSLSEVEEFSIACATANRDQALLMLKSNPELVKELGFRRGELLGNAAGSNNVPALKLMAELGFDLSILRHNTALHEAAWNGHMEAVKTLVELGADQTIRDRRHDGTPLDWAKYNQQHAVVEYLNALENQIAKKMERN